MSSEKNKNLSLVSIVIPIYNVEPYLAQCLDSVCAQTYTNLEIICVNDGSPDQSLAIATQYAERDPRVVIVSKENGGRSSARNAGMDVANGTYISFLDSDDWIDPRTCELALEAMQKHDCDLVMWGYMREFGDHAKKTSVFEGLQVFNESQCRSLHRRTIGLYQDEWRHPETADSLASMGMKLMKRSVIEEHHLRFVDTSVIGPWEDGLFTLYYLEHTKKAVYLDDALYHYRKGTGVTSKYNPNLRLLWKHRQEHLGEYIKAKGLGEVYEQALRNRNVWNLFSLTSNIMHLPPREAYGNLKSLLRDDALHRDIKSLELKYLPIHWRVLYLCAKWKCTPMVYLIFSYIKRKRSTHK